MKLVPISRPTVLLQMAREIAAANSSFHEVLGPGEGDKATNLFMRKLRTRAIDTFGSDFSEHKASGSTSLAADFYFPEEGTIIEVALGLPNPASEFEKDILKALMAQEFGHKVEQLLFISRPGAINKCNQPGRSAMIHWAKAKHNLLIEIHELDGEPRPVRRRSRSIR